ncbi:MAG: TraR/DksA C4-type zinc finger protein [Candidatus Hatepunaea meridiana]|nr:TraR/DksA C4-type zinc finger protein [Candidatus Hatepunaea meridiana]
MGQKGKNKIETQTKTQEVNRYSPEDKDYFQELITTRRNKILRELVQLKDATKNTVQEYSGSHSTYSLHMADQGTDAQEREKTFLFASRGGRYLKFLDRALDMINKGTYGYCRSCGGPIQKKRLELVPTARLCIACKLEEEKQRPK